MRLGQRVAGFGGEAHEDPVLLERKHRFEDVGIGLQRDLYRHLGFLEFGIALAFRSPVGDGRAHDQCVLVGEQTAYGRQHVERAHDVDAEDLLGGRQCDWSGDERDGVAALDRRLGDCKAHFAGRPVAEKTDGVEMLARRTCGN